jgi:hypothetical protein
MATMMWSRRTFSIATDGIEALTSDEFTTIMGGLLVDLVSAPIKPGIYTLRLTALMGGIYMFLPAYAKVELQGASFLGGKRLYQSNEFWQQVQEAFADSSVHVPTAPPAWAHASYTEHPVTLRLAINAIVGGARIYQLKPHTVASTHNQ